MNTSHIADISIVIFLLEYYIQTHTQIQILPPIHLLILLNSFPYINVICFRGYNISLDINCIKHVHSYYIEDYKLPMDGLNLRVA